MATFLLSLISVIATAALLDFIILYGGYYYFPSIPVPSSNDFGEKLKYTFRCIFPTFLVLQATIVNVAFKRAGNRISPLSEKESMLTAVQGILRNTLEQLVIYLGINMTLITYIQPSEMKIIPLYTVVFLVGRFLFIIGYPNRRGYGMFMHFVSTAYFGCLIIYLVCSRGFMYDIQSDAVEASQNHPKTEL